MMIRAYSTLEIKRAPGAAREISGLASTPSLDRAGDIVSPEGAEFTLPLPLLWQHDASAPIGRVTHANVSAKGIEFRARIAEVKTPGRLKDRLDEVWDSIEANLVRGTSIGFQPLDWKALPTGGRNYTRWSWHELSAVTIPCNQECSIETIKALDRQYVMRATRVVKLERPVSNAVVAELDRVVKGEGADEMLARSLGAAVATTDECLGQLDQRMTTVEALLNPKALAAMTPDEFLAHRRALRRIGAA
ncbi:HK97 family phage prohead protease [Sphingopyxis witflariensis]|uniref:Peptidase U35 n=1 Tax=Sphingopyxis witflariensis TaxID=173675 RepID=A0A246K4H7_9SPHN|nr:HK97 family phage prohead protease [Sphingopyxis witflariensis]OWR00873.1 peptidase U35 [Sphingopyxis witflariensis]